ncbi:MAG: hypothetical protein HKN23_09210 [Verrucomicrobiales bacterium]|nr:hypothetical protein [Verrucomicrobiales bacterium]
MKRTLLVACLFGTSTIFAGSGKEEVIAPEAPIGATISTGYMTNYIFYGVDFGEDAIWTGLDYTINALPIPVDVGVWYINPTSGPGEDDELDLYASVGDEFAGFDVSLTFAAYLYPEFGSGETYELALGVGRSLGIVDVYTNSLYDFEIEGWYFEVGAEKGFDLTDTIGLVVSGGVAYQSDYNSAGDDWNHAYVQASFPIALRSNVTLEPYIAGLFALDAVDDFQEDLLHGGVSLSVSF